MRIVGLLLIILGIAMLVTGSLTIPTKKKVLDTDRIDISRTENKTITWPWFAGGVSVAGGVLLMIVSRKTKQT